MSSAVPVTANQPWASGPAEILQHGIRLLGKDTDTNRRLAILSIDNAVELMIKTYLGLPRRITGLPLGRSEFAQICESFPKLLDALEKYAAEKLDGIDLGEIEWYHRLRNQLYHEGNGLTVERVKVVVYSELARLLFQRLFGVVLEVPKSDAQGLIGEFVMKWAELEQLLVEGGLRQYWRPTSHLPTEAMSRTPSQSLKMEFDRRVDTLNRLRRIRNEVIHGGKTPLTRDEIAELDEVVKALKLRLANR